MKILITNNFEAKLIDLDFVPRIGDKVDLFYKPLPTVHDVICFPSKENLKIFTLEDLMEKIQAIVFVK